MSCNPTDAENRILAFAMEQGLQRLAAVETLIMDGTFDLAPPLFTQIYVIWMPLKDAIVSTAYAILKGNNRDGYGELFDTFTYACDGLHFPLSVR